MQTVIHTCFEDCQDYTLDKFWKDVFNSCACGKFPRGCRYDPATRTLYTRIQVSSNKTKGEAICLPQSSEEIYKVLIDVFKNKFGMFSSRDLQIKKEELENIQDQQRTNMDCEWKKLKPRSVKEFLISNYVNDLQIKYTLSPKETKNLLAYINIWLQLKKITSDDIDYNNHAITSIKGIMFDESTRTFKNLNPMKITNKVEKMNKPQKFDQSINKFVRDHKYRKSKF